MRCFNALMSRTLRCVVVTLSPVACQSRKKLDNWRRVPRPRCSQHVGLGLTRPIAIQSGVFIATVTACPEKG